MGWSGETGRSVYEQPETEVDESCHSKEGSKKVKGNKGKQEGQRKGKQKARDALRSHYLLYIRVHSECL